MTGPGTLIADRYRIVRHLGSGSMASVHLAGDQVLGRHVAIKVVHADPKSDFGRRVLREARMGASLGHPNLVAVFDTIVAEDALLLVMEYVPGQTLAEALRGNPMAPEQALAILRPLAEALDHAHAAGIVHRDVKPANVLLHERGDVKLADLGVAISDEVSRITQTGGIVGTAAYMAPEQFEAGPVDAAADVYALAAVAFEMLSGRRAFPAPGAVAAMAQRSQDPPDLRELVPDAPAAAAIALQRGMAPRAADRPITASALVDELEAAYRRAAPQRAAAAHPPAAREPDIDPTPSPPPPRGTSHTDAPPAPPARTAGRDVAAASAAATPPRRRTPTPARTQDKSRPRRAAPLAALALLLVAGIVVALVLAASGDDEPSGGRAAAPSTQSRTTTTARTSTTPGSTTPGTAAPALPAASPRSAAGAVRAFYERAAADDLDGAWELAGPGLRAQFGSRGAFDGTFRTLERVRFTRLAASEQTDTSATVALATVATHTDRSERCTGDAAAVRSGDQWRVDRVGVRCTRAG